MKLLNIFKSIKKHPEDSCGLAERIYRELEKNATGYARRLKSGKLMKKFNISDNKTFRAYIQEIRQNENFTKIICSEAGMNGGYWIATNEEEIQDTLDHLYKRAMEMLKTYSIIKKKSKKGKVK